jgi:hypothetical protein
MEYVGVSFDMWLSDVRGCAYKVKEKVGIKTRKKQE